MVGNEDRVCSNVAGIFDGYTHSTRIPDLLICTKNSGDWDAFVTTSMTLEAMGLVMLILVSIPFLIPLTLAGAVLTRGMVLL
jgi:sorbitol-specific phosphotransferase system component IIBC